jgi:hypothetical protein
MAVAPASPKLADARPRLDGREHSVMINGKRASL